MQLHAEHRQARQVDAQHRQCRDDTGDSQEGGDNTADDGGNVRGLHWGLIQCDGCGGEVAGALVLADDLGLVDSVAGELLLRLVERDVAVVLGVFRADDGGVGGRGDVAEGDRAGGCAGDDARALTRVELEEWPPHSTEGMEDHSRLSCATKHALSGTAKLIPADPRGGGHLAQFPRDTKYRTLEFEVNAQSLVHCRDVDFAALDVVETVQFQRAP